MLERPRGLELGADPDHGAVEDKPVPRLSHAPERDENGDGAAEGLGIEKGRQRLRVASAEGFKEGNAVVHDGVDVGDVSNESFGEAVALVVDGADGEPGLGEVDGRQLDEPAGLSGESVNDGQDSDDLRGGERRPPLSEELETSWISDVLGAVRDGVARIELFGG